MKENKLLQKSQNFAVDIIRLSEFLKSISQRNIADQIQRSATSIAANIAEGNHPQSRADMVSKFEIALKDANETETWLIICRDSKFITNQLFNDVHKKLVQIKIILISSIRTLKSKM